MQLFLVANDAVFAILSEDQKKPSREEKLMAYSESLARRVREAIGKQRGMAEKKMFGGVCFLLHGNLCVGIWKTSLIARLGPEQAAAALQEPYVGEFDVTGRPMKGWVMIEPDGLESERQLALWLERAQAFVETLPKK